MCLHPKCSDNDFPYNYRKTSNQDKVTIHVVAEKRWEAKKAERAARQTNTVLVRAHMHVSFNDKY